MKKSSVFIAAALMASVWVATTPVSATTTACFNPYTVEVGDNLWRLAQVKLQDPWRWTLLERVNPILREPSRYSFDDRGRLIVLIKPGEQLCGLEGAGINPVDFGTPRPPTLMDTPAPSLSNREVIVTSGGSPKETDWPWWPWWLVPLVLLIVVLGLWFSSRRPERNHNRTAPTNDPATAGPPMVHGGLTDANADEAFRQMAQRRFGGEAQGFTVLERVPGRVYGAMLTSYQDGTERAWTMTGQRAWRARVRFANGHEETLYSLQQCGNDLRFGGVGRPGADFRFEADPVEAPVAPAQPILREEAAVVPAQSEAEIVPPGTISVKIKPAGNNEPNLVEVKGVNPTGVSIEVSPTGFRFRYVSVADQPATTPPPAA